MSQPQPATFPFEVHADRSCANCGHTGMTAFYSLSRIPVQSNLLLASRDEAMAIERGDLTLGFCERCAFIANLRFDDRTQEHSARYEVTQGFSASFGSFIRSLAETLIDRHDIRGRTVVEIGCGAGEFLAAICTLGDNRGYGIDPSTDPERIPNELAPRLTLLNEYYRETHGRLVPDLICCRHTLEHIPRTREFMQLVRRSIDPDSNPVVVFEVPDAHRIIDEAAFWDIYYEHCNYFCAKSLAGVFESAGFVVERLERLFDDQYLLITARPGSGGAQRKPGDDVPSPDRKAVQLFREKCSAKLEMWSQRMREFRENGQRVALWGSGSKAVGFLSTVRSHDAVDCIVDINPNRQGMFSPGTAHEIVAPDRLIDRRPDAVIIMNPVYRDEIGRTLDGLGVETSILTVEDD